MARPRTPTPSGPDVVFNGRFLAAPQTGVQRVALEMLRAFNALLCEDEALAVRTRSVLAAPRDISNDPQLSRIPTVRAGLLSRRLWEQISLPRFVPPAARLVNLCNLAPISRPGFVMIHDAQVYLSPNTYSAAYRAYYKSVQPLIAARADKILTVSDYSKSMLVKYGLAEPSKIAVIHNGVDHMTRVRATDGKIRELGLSGAPFVVALANTQAHKNIKVLIAAFESARLAGIRLILVGSAQARDFEAKGLRPPAGVVFAGWVSDEELRGLCEAALCYAFPSWTEGFGLPPMEAMALGCPAIVAPCGALPEVCGTAAAYADADDPEAWVAAIEQLAGDPERRRAASAAGVAHAAAFTWRRSARRLVELLQT